MLSFHKQGIYILKQNQIKEKSPWDGNKPISSQVLIIHPGHFLQVTHKTLPFLGGHADVLIT